MSRGPPYQRFEMTFRCDDCGFTLGCAEFDNMDMSILKEKAMAGPYIVDREVLEVTLKLDMLDTRTGWFSRPKWRIDERTRYTRLHDTIKTTNRGRGRMVEQILDCHDLCISCYGELEPGSKEGWVTVHRLSFDRDGCEEIQQREGVDEDGPITRREPVRIRYRRF